MMPNMQIDKQIEKINKLMDNHSQPFFGPIKIFAPSPSTTPSLQRLQEKEKATYALA